MLRQYFNWDQNLSKRFPFSVLISWLSRMSQLHPKLVDWLASLHSFHLHALISVVRSIIHNLLTSEEYCDLWDRCVPHRSYHWSSAHRDPRATTSAGLFHNPGQDQVAAALGTSICNWRILCLCTANAHLFRSLHPFLRVYPSRISHYSLRPHPWTWLPLSPR